MTLKSPKCHSLLKVGGKCENAYFKIFCYLVIIFFKRSIWIILLKCDSYMIPILLLFLGWVGSSLLGVMQWKIVVV